MEQVRRSVVRICFDWQKKYEEKTMTMVIPGVILLIDNGEATIAANSTFFKNDEVLNCMVNFPNAAGYEDGLHLPKALVANGENFSTFTLRPREHGYITPVKFETQCVNNNDQVNAFVFPRENYVTPVGYTEGFIISASERVLHHDCDMHEYGYLGSPVFNLRGHLIGITYLDKGHYQAWSVFQLQKDVLRGRNCTLVYNSEPVETPAIAGTQMVE